MAIPRVSGLFGILWSQWELGYRELGRMRNRVRFEVLPELSLVV